MAWASMSSAISPTGSAASRRSSSGWWCRVMVVIYSRLTDPTALLIAGAVMGFFVNGMLGGYGALMSELYPTAARATAQNVLFNVGRAVAGFRTCRGGRPHRRLRLPDRHRAAGAALRPRRAGDGVPDPGAAWRRRRCDRSAPSRPRPRNRFASRRQRSGERRVPASGRRHVRLGAPAQPGQFYQLLCPAASPLMRRIYAGP